MNKVTIISRQSNEPTLDILLLMKELSERNIYTVVLTKKLEKNLKSVLSYLLHMLVQVYHVLTSRVVVVDGYCIVLSILPKRKKTKTIQMWHALGAVKKFGWQVIGKKDGHSYKVARLMRMHKNYDYYLAPSHLTGKFYSEAFNTPIEKAVYIGLPRIDYLKRSDEEKRNIIREYYPQIEGKKNVLYAPTFRKNENIKMDKLISQFKLDGYNYIIKTHPLDKCDYTRSGNKNIIFDTKFTSIEWLKICDILITDYSAMIFEGAILEKELYIYQNDIDCYSKDVGLNIILENESIGQYAYYDEKKLSQQMKQKYEKNTVVEFKKKYIEIPTENCTKALCDFIELIIE